MKLDYARYEHTVCSATYEKEQQHIPSNAASRKAPRRCQVHLPEPLFNALGHRAEDDDGPLAREKKPEEREARSTCPPTSVNRNRLGAANLSRYLPRFLLPKTCVQSVQTSSLRVMRRY